jgi:hypothetical protein
MLQEARSSSSSHISPANLNHSGAVEAQPVSRQYMVAILHFDGASKGNPGKAGAGAVLMTEDGRVVLSILNALTKFVVYLCSLSLSLILCPT